MSAKNTNKLNPVWFALFGLYLLGGAAYTLLSGKWFPGFPVQFDALGLSSANFEAAIAALLGAGCVYFGWHDAATENDDQ